MKTAKEKAKQLVWRFMPWEEEVYLDEIALQRDLVAAKECAMICAEELAEERERAVKICYSAYDRYCQSEKSKRAAGNEFAFVEGKIADECRLTGNAIADKNALTVALKEKDYYEQVKSEIEKL